VGARESAPTAAGFDNRAQTIDRALAAMAR
jgi:hypothetical protein